MPNLTFGRAARHVVQMMLGTGSAQALTLLAAPWLSRLYDPSAFGTYGVFLSLATTVAAVATLRYELAIVVEADEARARHGVALALSVTLVMTGLMATTVWLARDGIAKALGVPDLAPQLWWLVLSLLGAGCFQTLNYWSTRRERFRSIGTSQFVRSVSVVGSQVAAGVRGLGAGGLIGGAALGPSVAAVALGWQVWREDGRLLARSTTRQDLTAFARRHAKFPMFGAPQALLNAISQGLPALLLGASFGAATVGLYVMAVRTLQMPINLVGQAVRQVLLARAARTRDQGGDLLRLYLVAVGVLAGIVLIPAIGLAIVSPWLFGLVLGPDWTTSGEYARWLLLWLVLLLVNAPATAYVQLLGYQRLLLGYDVALLAARAVAILVGAHFGDALLSIALFSSVGAIFNVWLIAKIALAVRRAAPERA